MCIKPYIPDTSGCPKNIRFRCIQKKNTSELHKIRQFRCIHLSKSINLSNPRCHIIPSEANLRANQSEIHQNSTKSGNPDVSTLPKPSTPSKKSPIKQIKQPALPLSPNSKRISAQIKVKYIKIPRKHLISIKSSTPEPTPLPKLYILITYLR